MRVSRVFIDTSVFGGMFDPEFDVDTRAFFAAVDAGRFQFVVSDQIVREILPAPNNVRQLFSPMPRTSPTPRFMRARGWSVEILLILSMRKKTDCSMWRTRHRGIRRSLSQPKRRVYVMAKNNKYACFQWIRDVRSRMNEDTEDMTPEERVAYNRAGAEKALAVMPKLSLAEARRQRQAILHPETVSVRTRRSRVVKSVSKQGKAAKRLVHA